MIPRYINNCKCNISLILWDVAYLGIGSHNLASLCKFMTPTLGHGARMDLWNLTQVTMMILRHLEIISS